jgi:hypothetical protein
MHSRRFKSVVHEFCSHFTSLLPRLKKSAISEFEISWVYLLKIFIEIFHPGEGKWE